MTDVDPASPPPVSAAPPTEPGAIGDSGVKPTSPWAVWSFACGIVGLLVSPLALVAVGLGVFALRRLAEPDNRRQGRGLAHAGLWTGVVGVLLLPVYVLMAWGVVSAVSGAGRMEAVQDLRLVHEQAVALAETNGRYPVHPAEMIVDTKGDFDAHRRVRGHDRDAVTDVLLGGYDFANFDGSARSFGAIAAALERIDETEMVYAFGDCWFVRLDRPRDDPDLVFGWWPDPDGVFLQVVMDDGSVQAIADDEWSDLWAADAAARDDAGLPPLEKPAPR